MANSTRVITLYDAPMWESIEHKAWSLQCCSHCKAFRYPPSPICDECHSMEYAWTPLKGEGELLSWTVFHRKYFDDHPPPYNAVAVRLVEGPTVVTNVDTSDAPTKDWIGKPVRITYVQREGYVLPRVVFA